MSCFSETTDKNQRSCIQSMLRGENLEPKSQPPFPNQRIRTQLEFEHQNPSQNEGYIGQKDWALKPLTMPYHNLPYLTINGQVPRALDACPTGTSSYKPVPSNPLKLVLNSGLGRQIWVLSFVFLLVDFAIKSFSFLKSGAIVQASMHVEQWVLAQ